jgi:hypothetical protein
MQAQPKALASSSSSRLARVDETYPAALPFFLAQVSICAFRVRVYMHVIKPAWLAVQTGRQGRHMSAKQTARFRTYLDPCPPSEASALAILLLPPLHALLPPLPQARCAGCLESWLLSGASCRGRL